MHCITLETVCLMHIDLESCRQIFYSVDETVDSGIEKGCPAIFSSMVRVECSIVIGVMHELNML